MTLNRAKKKKKENEKERALSLGNMLTHAAARVPTICSLSHTQK